MKIVIADDHPLVLSGVRSALEMEGKHQLLGEASSADGALELVAALKPDLLLLDLEMPGPPVDELVRRAQRSHPKLKVLILSAHDRPEYLRPLKRLRISGFVLKDEAPESLLQALRVIAEGSHWWSRTIAARLHSLAREEGETIPELTPREREILEHILLGKHNYTIAEELGLAEQTVRRYASVIYQKIGVSNRLETVIWAQRAGLSVAAQSDGKVRS